MFDSSTMPPNFPSPSTRINKINSIANFWNPSWDKPTVKLSQIMNTLRTGLFLYEVQAFFNLYYGKSSIISKFTEAAKNLNLTADFYTARPYNGPNVNYLATQAKASASQLSKNLFIAAKLASLHRNYTYTLYMMA